MHDRRSFLAAAAATLAGLERTVFDSTGAAPGPLASLRRATTWLNSPPLTADALQGKVVLVDFWTYTCINWLRTEPYVRAWSQKYRELGLVVIGVHTPEFGFERDLDNVRRYAKELRVNYPIAVDTDYGIWNGFDNHYWPALYLIDARGTLRHQQFGEGGYDEAERAIQKLLVEAGAGGVPSDLARLDGQGIEAPADWDNLRSPENYLGTGRSEGFVSGRDSPLGLNQWTLAGNWNRSRQNVALQQSGGRIRYRFHARDLHLVMGPPARGTTVRFRVRLDGQVPGPGHGEDVDEQGQGIATGQRLYQLIRQRQPVTDRLFEVEFLDAGVEAFAFTFG